MGKIKLFKIIGTELRTREVQGLTDKQLTKKVNTWKANGWVTEAEKEAIADAKVKLSIAEAELNSAQSQLSDKERENEELKALVAKLQSEGSAPKEKAKIVKDITRKGETE